MKLKIWIFAVSVAGFALSANAITAVGMVSCGSYISSVDNRTNSANYSWVAGYLSGVSMGLNVDLLKQTDGASIRLWMENYCRKNPLKNTADAADQLAIELMKANAK